MMISPRIVLVGCLLVVFALQVHAADDSSPAHNDADASRTWQLNLYWENDGIFNMESDQDRHYTNGVAITLTTQPQWADKLFAAVGLPAKKTAVGLGISHQIYTATNIALSNPPSKDHPYAGYLYGSLYAQREKPFLQTTIPSLDHFQLDLGVVGQSAGGEWLQKKIHNAFSGQDPKGWNTQLADEVAVQFFYRKKWRIDLPDLELNDIPSMQWQIIPHAGVALGTVHRYAEFGSVYRIGWNLPDDFGPGRLADYVSATGRSTNPHANNTNRIEKLSFYGFGRTTVQFVEWNTFLDGNAYHNSRFAGSKPIVGEFQIGAAIGGQWKKWKAQLLYAITFQTDRYQGQATKDSYATLMLAVTRPW